MAASFSLPTVLANLAAGNQPLALIDGDFTAIYNPLISLNTYSNYYTDVGAANAYVITVSSPQTVTQAAGLRVQFIATNVNTGASTFQINALAVKNIKNIDGSAVGAGQIPASGVVDLIYDGTQYLLLNPRCTTPLMNSLSGNVALNNTGTYFDGPIVSQGTVGTWFVSGSILVQDTAGSAFINCRLWDGTSTIASQDAFISTVNATMCVSLSGVITAPVANLRISCKDVTSTSGQILFNHSGNSKDSTITAIRIF